MKFCFIDLETTGLYPGRHGVWQIAGCLTQPQVENRWFNFKCSPFHGDVVDAKALEVGGITEDELRAFKTPQSVYEEFITLLSSRVNRYNKQDKMFFIAYNANFDMEHLRAWFKKAGDNYFGSYFFFPDICVMRLAQCKLLKKRHELPDFKLHTVARALGVEVDDSKLHDALYDIKITMEIWNKVMSESVTLEGFE